MPTSQSTWGQVSGQATPYGQQSASPQGQTSASWHAVGRTGAPVLVSIGDIQVTTDQVLTPSGAIPLARAQFTFQDSSVTQSKIPTWAIILAVIGFLFFFLGLLFLFVRETTTTGFVTVSVVGPGFTHTTHVPVASPQQVNEIAARVQHANNVALAQRT